MRCADPARLSRQADAYADRVDDSAPAGTVRIALTRHGQTEWNAQGRFQGSSDVPLNDIGRAQAAESAQRFQRTDWDAVVTSPLARAAETGRIIADAVGLPLRDPITDLVERHYGAAEGMDEAVAAQRWPGGDYPGIESRADVAARGQRAIHTIASRLPGQRVIVVAHGTLIREVLRRLTDSPVPPILNAATSIIERTKSGWRVLTVNDETHLP